MQDQLHSLLTQAKAEAPKIQTRAEHEAWKARYVGPRGYLTEVMKGMRDLAADQKPVIGKVVNEVKVGLEALFAEALQRVESAELVAKMGKPIDVSLPPCGDGLGSAHPLSQVRDLITSIFRKVGFTIAVGPEVDTEWYCFDALGTSEDHPSRSESDTYYFPESAQFVHTSKHDKERYLLRTHTSTVQIRTMLQTPPPVRIVVPGRCFRRDTADATHSANFHQIEGLSVDTGVTIRDLRAILDYFLRELFGQSVKTRLRPSYFPFTEPSFEVDLMSPHLGKLKDRWIEVMGCGMVDPKVFASVGYDPDLWSGWAFGMGIERIAMLLQGVDDIRHYYNNDLRFLKQFQS
jgi:phenylalanyl-tRNA synthetase alpha chain